MFNRLSYHTVQKSVQFVSQLFVTSDLHSRCDTTSVQASTINNQLTSRRIAEPKCLPLWHGLAPRARLLKHSHCTPPQYLPQTHTRARIHLGAILSHPSPVLAEVARTLHADASLLPALFRLSCEKTTGCGTQLRAYISTTPYYEAKPPSLPRGIHNNVFLLV
jgi:hypothetical protein